MRAGFPFPVKDCNGLCAERESRQWQETIHSQRHCFPLRMTDRRRHSSISTVSGRKPDQGRISLLTGRHLHIRRPSLLYMPVVTGMSPTACRRAGARHHPCRGQTPVVPLANTSRFEGQHKCDNVWPQICDKWQKHPRRDDLPVYQNIPVSLPAIASIRPAASSASAQLLFSGRKTSISFIKRMIERPIA